MKANISAIKPFTIGFDVKKETTKLADKRITRKHMPFRLIYVLEREYNANPNWDGQKIADLAKELIIPKVKVYKWNWDRRKKGPPSKPFNQPSEPGQSFLAKQFFKEIRKGPAEPDKSR